MPKSKPKSRRKINFVAPFSLEKCVTRLDNKGERDRDLWRRPAFSVHLSRVDADTYRFRISKRAGKNYSAAIDGLLKRQDENSTLVIGGTAGELIVLVVVIVLTLLFVVTMLTGGVPARVTLPFSLVLVIAGGIGWMYMKLESRVLLRSLQDTLGYVGDDE